MSSGKTKLLREVQFVPGLAHNLLSVGQLTACGYTVVFKEGECSIKDVNAYCLVARVPMTQHRLFPLEVNEMGADHVVHAQMGNLWHKRYGHLNFYALQELNQMQMVLGLPSITSKKLCEGCLFGKHTRFSFPKGDARRSTIQLELVHSDLCGPMQTASLGGSFIL